jgi:hypothetical protein
LRPRPSESALAAPSDLTPSHPTGLPGVVQDLKLPPEKHALAFAIVSRPNLLRTADLTNKDAYEMRALLDDEEYENFAAAAARVAKKRMVIID